MGIDLSKLSRYPAPIRLTVFVLILGLVWIPIALPIQWFVSLHAASPAESSNTATLLTLPLLYIEFILLVRFWGRRVYQQPNLLWRYGLEFSRRSGRELLLGLTIGFLSLFALFIFQGAAGWLIWQPPPVTLVHLVLEGFVVALAIGFAEELLFRGWLLDELQRDYDPKIALWVSALIFAAVHGIKPQFPALLLFGATLVWAKRSRTSWEVLNLEKIRRSRLALPMGLHAGLVWGYYIINVGQWVQYPNHAPVWVTGIDRNPLAGLAGILFLCILALLMRQLARKRE
ncbi:CPBP family intramembrane metalloprotease [Kovacikia minuta CCNUW1]|uniref:CPBP family intramembrane glutamic endopeptidase n=1 Tax=Kovacikia minuta TaxID=2931930 RepID=UPI001CCC939F|nr:type II CAAX endopeptidase family protein [Kovacikia minuta]UBF25349.1 CPBP family intramembrane metalloprotease [Kovacikia minuta CCNUW1]